MNVLQDKCFPPRFSALFTKTFLPSEMQIVKKKKKIGILCGQIIG